MIHYIIYIKIYTKKIKCHFSKHHSNLGCGTNTVKGADTTVEDKIDSYAYEVVFSK